MKDDKYHVLRTKMVREQIQNRGITDGKILQVFEYIQRHIFVRPGDEELAYQDSPLPFYENQTISQPYIVAEMINALDLTVEDKLLEIGTGSGYQTALLANLVEKVYTIERLPVLYNKAKETLEKLDISNVEYALQDGKKGWISEAPFSKIIVSAASRNIPQELINQLEVGGKMIIPVGGPELQKLLLIQKHDQYFEEKVLGYCKFVKLI